MQRFGKLCLGMSLLFALAMYAQNAPTSDPGSSSGAATQDSNSTGSSIDTGASKQATKSQDQQAPDNTTTNQRDRNPSEVTADQQKENPSDRKLTKDIRRALMKDGSLSTYAHNIKIISQDGKVTLKGPVRSDEEKQAIEAKATEIAGSGNVTDQLQIADQDQKK